MKKAVKRAGEGIIIGIAIGQIMGVIISLISGSGDYTACAPEFTASIGNEAAAAALQTLLCALMGLGFGAASVIWEMDELSIAAQTAICFAVYSVFMLPIAYISYWMEHSAKGFLIYFGVFTAIFVAIWAMKYLMLRKNVNAINKGLK